MPALKPTKARQKLNIMVIEKVAWLKTNESKTETEHNGDWKNAGINPLQEMQKMNIMVTEIMHAKKPMNAKIYIIKVNINPTHKFYWMHT